MEMSVVALKQQLRKEIRELSRSLSEDERRLRSHQICIEVEQQEAFQQAEHLLLYHPLTYEVSTLSLLHGYFDSKKIYLPIVDGNDLFLVRYQGEKRLIKGAFGVMEPVGERFSQLDQITCVIVPGVAFDPHGNRLGYGKGYYDRLLPQLPNATRIGIGFSHQLVDQVPVEPSDLPMNRVITG
ncbi:5-formyltetrahydrofolate cyclo-ligase [Porphyromonadaceae bacterium]